MMGSSASMVAANKAKLIQLVDGLLKEGVIQTQRVEQVMKTVDRQDFVSGSGAYQDRPQQIDYNATISAPHMHAYCLEWLSDNLKTGSNILDVGCGSGYLLAAFYEMTKEGEGKIVGIEHIDGLAQFSINNLQKSYNSVLESGRIEVVVGDGRNGYEKYAPYDIIHVGAAIEKIPQPLIDQLAEGGKLVIPVGPQGSQNIVMVEKDTAGAITQRKLLGVRYIPLTSKEDQCPHLYPKTYK